MLVQVVPVLVDLRLECMRVGVCVCVHCFRRASKGVVWSAWLGFALPLRRAVRRFGPVSTRRLRFCAAAPKQAAWGSACKGAACAPQSLVTQVSRLPWVGPRFGRARSHWVFVHADLTVGPRSLFQQSLVAIFRGGLLQSSASVLRLCLVVTVGGQRYSAWLLASASIAPGLARAFLRSQPPVGCAACALGACIAPSIFSVCSDPKESPRPVRP